VEETAFEGIENWGAGFQVRNNAKLAQKLGQLQPFTAVLTGMHGPTCIFWANLTSVALQSLFTGDNTGKVVVKV
jgi:hypothetical protein